MTTRSVLENNCGNPPNPNNNSIEDEDTTEDEQNMGNQGVCNAMRELVI